MFCKKSVLRNFAKFTGKHLCQSLRPATLLKKRLVQVFSCEFCDISKNTFYYRTPSVAACALSSLLQVNHTFSEKRNAFFPQQHFHNKILFLYNQLYVEDMSRKFICKVEFSCMWKTSILRKNNWLTFIKHMWHFSANIIPFTLHFGV